MAADTSMPGLLQPPSGTTTIWRYMCVGEFETLLETSQLHLTQVASFTDSFEGSMPRAVKEAIDHHFATSGVDPRSKNKTSYPSWRAREWHYATCWCIDEREHEGLWRAYGDVAIASTYQALVNTFDEQSWAGMMQYVDYDDVDAASVHDCNIMMLKRAEYSWEREIRVVRRCIKFAADAGSRPVWEPGWFDKLYDQPKRIMHEIAIPDLVKGVRVSPYAEKTVRERVVAIARAAHIDGLVRESTLARDPFV